MTSCSYDVTAIVVVEPEVPENTGFIARLCSNFDYELRLVNPNFNLSEARKTCKNSQDTLRNTKIFDSLPEALQDLEFVVGTKPEKGISCQDFKFRKNTSIVLGRESKGLSNSELELCDTIVHIPSTGYNSVNLSHAAAIIMYEASSSSELAAESSQLEIVEKRGGKILRDLVARSSPTSEELNRLLGEL